MKSSTDRTSLRVLVVSDNQIVRLGLKSLLETQPDIQLVGETGIAAIEQGEHILIQCPDVILLDVGPGLAQSSLPALKKIAERVNFILLCDLGDFKVANELRTQGVTMVVLKTQPPSALIAAIHSLTDSGTDGCERKIERKETASSVQGKSGDNSLQTTECINRLSERQREIVRLIAQGLKNKEVANRLCLSDITIRHHLTHIFKKFNVRNRQKLLVLVRTLAA